MYIKGISVIICCYNSESRLPETLQHLATQKASLPWEIIIIDNNSSDNTYATAQKLWDKHRPECNADFYIHKEPKPGKSNALELAFANSHYSYIVICDDDNWLSNNYLSIVYEVMEQRQEIGIMGGKCLPVYEIEPPYWINQYVGGYACSSSEYEPSKYVSGVFGAGMALRKCALDQLITHNFKNILSSQRGGKITNGEDAEHCKVFALLGYKIWFDNRLLLHHFIPKEKLNWSYCKKLFASFGQSSVLLSLYDRALETNVKNEKLPYFYWLNRTLYFFLVQIKYYPKFRKELNKEGSGIAILYLSWKLKMYEYWILKWKINAAYRKILDLKRNLNKTIAYNE